MTDEQFSACEWITDFYFENLKFCGCNRPQDIMLTIKTVLNLIKNRLDNNIEFWENESKINEAMHFKVGGREMSNIQEGMYSIILNVLDNVGVLEHGGNIRHAWLTDYGKELLEKLNMIEDMENVIIH